MIEVQHLTKTYQNGSGKLYALRDVSFSVEAGDFLVVLGPSGSGKSTLLNAISGLERPDSGAIIYDGVDIAQKSEAELTAFRRANTAYVFQQYFLLPTLTAEANVRLGAELAGSREVAGAFAAVGLTGKEKMLPHQLSGGEQQRVSIARALAKQPRVLFCDEPTGALDEETGRQVMRHLVERNRTGGLTLVMVTHNANFAALATKVLRMNSGRLVELRVQPSPCGVDEIGW